VPFADAADLFLSRKVDAVSARQSTIVELAQQLDDKVLVISTEGIYTFRYLLVGNQTLIQEHPEIVDKVLQALVRAEAYAKQHPEDARAITAARLGADQSVVDEVWQRYHFSINLSQPIFVTLEDEARWLMDREGSVGMRTPNFLDHIYFDALEHAKPGAVTIPH
jgi:NitT/TauT family transport system substrate-binding protein